MMGKSNQHQSNQTKTPSRDRYWSLMLVGDHGRIIPFRRFKGIAIAGLAIVVIAVSALIVLGFMYKHQSTAMARLQGELDQVRQHVGQLRDEKDVLLAQLVIQQKMDPKEISTALGKVPPAKAESVASPPPEVKPAPIQAAAEPIEAEPPIEKAVPEPPPKPKPEPVKVIPGAEIQQFKAGYRLDRSLLQASFRIYNRSKPKEQLVGKSVVIFKNQEDPQVKWLTIPTLQLTDGMPDGTQGKDFSIRNYRTMEFKAYGIKPPVRFSTVVAMVFSDDGTLILSREFEVDIDARALPVPEEKPVPAPKTPAAENSVTPATENNTPSTAPSTLQAPASSAPQSATQPDLQEESEAPAAAGSEAEPVPDSPQVSPEEAIPSPATSQPDEKSSVNFHSNR
jgi:hypothetical protein